MPQGLKKAIKGMAKPFEDEKVDAVAGIEARGFILGGAIADRLECGFIPIRKKGKLPWKTIGQEYTLEYGVDVIEVHEDAIEQGYARADRRRPDCDGRHGGSGREARAAVGRHDRRRDVHRRSAGSRRHEAARPNTASKVTRWSHSEDTSATVDLPGERLKDALACIAAWRIDPDAPRNCPVCGAAGTKIIDRSARPYSEWYVLRCEACGLDATIHIPLSGPSGVLNMAAGAQEIVLLPGLDGTGDLFDRIGAFLAADFIVKIVRYPNDPSLGYAGYVELVRNEIGGRDVFLLGESFSGPVAVRVATQLGRQIKGIVLAATFVKNPWPGWLLRRAARVDPETTPAKIRDAILMGRYGDDELRKKVDVIVRALSRPVRAARLRAVAEVDVRQRLFEARVPDPGVARSRRLAGSGDDDAKGRQQKGGARMVVFPAAHMLLQTRAEEIAAEIICFCEVVGADGDCTMKIDGVPSRTIWLEQDGWSVGILDQTALPHQIVRLTLEPLKMRRTRSSRCRCAARR